MYVENAQRLAIADYSLTGQSNDENKGKTMLNLRSGLTGTPLEDLIAKSSKPLTRDTFEDLNIDIEKTGVKL